MGFKYWQKVKAAFFSLGRFSLPKLKIALGFITTCATDHTQTGLINIFIHAFSLEIIYRLSSMKRHKRARARPSQFLQFTLFRFCFWLFLSSNGDCTIYISILYWRSRRETRSAQTIITRTLINQHIELNNAKCLVFTRQRNYKSKPGIKADIVFARYHTSTQRATKYEQRQSEHEWFEWVHRD